VTPLAHTGHVVGYVLAIAAIVAILAYDVWRRRRARP
jgi:hypothetical protein